MKIREAQIQDITQIQVVRNSVKENALSHPSVISDSDCEEYLFQRGKGWVCELDEKIVGFAIVDLAANNIWALFIHPEFERQGIGRQLHDIMLNWYFSQTRDKIWLSTASKTRAEKFYRVAGWTDMGIHREGEIKFEMTFSNWMAISGRVK